MLAGIVTILRGFDITGLEEADMPWFRKYLSLLYFECGNVLDTKIDRCLEHL